MRLCGRRRSTNPSSPAARSAERRSGRRQRERDGCGRCRRGRLDCSRHGVVVDHRAAGMAPCPRADALGPGRLGVPPTSRAASPTLKTIYVLPAGPPSPSVIGLEYRPVGAAGATGTSRVKKQLPARLGVAGSTMKTLKIGLGTLVLVALTRPALAQRCLSFRAPAFFAGAAVAPGYPYPAYGYPVYPYPLPPAPSLGFGRGGIYGHVLVGRDESITSYTFPGRDSWQ